MIKLRFATLGRAAFAFGAVALGCASVAATASPPANPIVFERMPRAVLAATGASRSSAPSMFFTASGHVYLLAATKQADKAALRLFLSNDGGDTFGDPISVTPPMDIMTHGEMAPRLARDPLQRSMYVLWEGTVDAGDALRVQHASMWAHAFSAPVTVTDKAKPSSNSFATLATAPNGDVYAAWLDGREGPNKNNTSAIFVARSTDGGVTFGKNVRVALDACPCCRPALAFAEDGTMYLGWRQDFPGDYRDMVIASSHDSGATWSQPARVNEDGWSIQGCPDSGPALAVHDGVLHVVWYTLGRSGRAQVRASSSTDGRHFAPAVTISTNVMDANHPMFASGPAPYPIVVFEGRDPGGAGFGKSHVFVTGLRGGRWSAPEAVPSGGHDLSDPVAAMRDSATIYIAATADDGKGPSVMLIRGRFR